ncbi:MAG: hypothetical protein RBT63_02090 [Bdellovibrionales bacterium]|jgi:predicted  nucleic acid-binding Zn-ribbon protein|nr:hypothetical protein [Bdellovibrionales bacterium]
MSAKKKTAPGKPAPKDDLIDALLENEEMGSRASKSQTKSQTVSRLTDLLKGRKSPPPPPAGKIQREDDVFDFESDVMANVEPEMSVAVDDADVPSLRLEDESDEASAPTLSLVTPSIPDVSVEVEAVEVEPVVNEMPDSSDDFSLNGVSIRPVRTQHVSIENDSDLLPDDGSAGEPTKEVSAKESRKLQKLEDVLRKLQPGYKRDRPSEPLYPPREEHAEESDAAEFTQTKPMDVFEMPPPAPERAPTEPVREAAMTNAADADERTIALSDMKAASTKPNAPQWQDAKTEVLSPSTRDNSLPVDPDGEKFMPTEIRPNSPGAKFREEARQVQPGAAIFSSAEAALRQSENLRVAQKRISDLENELERVRRENESLRSASETLRRRMSELQANAESAELNTQETKKIAEEERKVLRGQIASRDREIAELKTRIDDAESRLESNFRKIRVRERDLEHRIEIIKAESQSITASKDRMILELKRQIDQLNSELSHAKAQVQETFGQFKEKQETARRAVRALRIALTVLEGEEESGSRKAE